MTEQKTIGIKKLCMGNISILFQNMGADRKSSKSNPWREREDERRRKCVLTMASYAGAWCYAGRLRFWSSLLLVVFNFGRL